MVGTVSRTARVSGVTRNLKEAVSKTLARRTEIAYEAGISGREGKHLQSPITIQEGMFVYAAGIWGEGHAHYPGRSAVPLWAKSRSRGAGKQFSDVRQKSAEAIRAGITARQRAEHVATDRNLEFRWREQRQKSRQRGRGPGRRVGARSPERKPLVSQASRQ